MKAKNPNAEIICNVYVSPNQDVDKVREMWRAGLNEYLNAPGYAAAQEWMGHGDELRKCWDKWKKRDRKGAAAAIPDAFVDSLVSHGPMEEVREKVQRYVDNGVDTVVFDLEPGVVDAMETARGLAPR